MTKTISQRIQNNLILDFSFASENCKKFTINESGLSFRVVLIIFLGIKKKASPVLY